MKKYLVLLLVIFLSVSCEVSDDSELFDNDELFEIEELEIDKVQENLDKQDSDGTRASFGLGNSSFLTIVPSNYIIPIIDLNTHYEQIRVEFHTDIGLSEAYFLRREWIYALNNNGAEESIVLRSDIDTIDFNEKGGYYYDTWYFPTDGPGTEGAEETVLGVGGRPGPSPSLCDLQEDCEDF